MRVAALVFNHNLNQFAPLLSQAARGLASAGVDRIVIPCNSLHTIASAITEATAVPFISIVDSTIVQLRQHRVKTVGLLGSCVTVSRNPFAKVDPTISFISPSPAIQKRMDKGLHQFVSTKQSQLLQNALKDAIDEFEEKLITNVLIACTDFHTLIPPNHRLTFFDTLDILVEATAKQIVGNTAAGVL